MTGEKFHFSRFFSFRNIARRTLPLSVRDIFNFQIVSSSDVLLLTARTSSIVLE